MIDTIHIQSGNTSREAIKAIQGAKKLGYQINMTKYPFRARSVPLGSVEYCESWLATRPKPDFYPSWLESWLHREIRRDVDLYQFCERGKWFIKSSCRYKGFEPRIWSVDDDPLFDLCDCSGVVQFEQEWRYYVADGCVLTTGWYSGNDEKEAAPDLNIDWPKGFCGAVDFGRLDNGKIALVESHHSFACGHYSDDHDAYVMWLVEGWKSVSAEFGLIL